MIKAKCMENNVDKKGKADCSQLTVSTSYKVLQWPYDGMFMYCVYLVDDSGTEAWYSKHRFEVIYV